jgi:DNA-directed RNA polymerase subunit RPC12/RpoP
MAGSWIQLRRPDHAAASPRAFSQLWGGQDFADVTLATADGQHIKVHKVIISSCSQFFRNILVKIPHPHPLIYLKGISYTKLKRVIQLIYLGQCQVGREEVQEIMDICADLDISGISEDIKFADMDVNQIISKTDIPADEGQLLIHASGNSDGLAVLPAKGKFVCNICEKEYKYPGDLTRHKENKHEGLRFACDECSYRGTKKQNVTNHKQVQHEGVRYGCDECDYKATAKGSLIKHRHVRHEGVRFGCGLCSYEAITKGSLATHKQASH